MRAFALALLLACTAAAAPNRGSHIAPRGGLSQHIPNLAEGGVLLSFLPTVAAAEECTGTSPTTLQGDALSFTRASDAYCQKTDGGMVLLTTDQPRIEPWGILIEAAATNTCIRSEAFEHAAWTATNVTVTANQAVAPNGATTADQLQSTVNGGLVESTAAAIVAGAANASVFVKTASGTQAMAIRLRDTTAGSDACTGTITATTAWQRVYCEGLIVSGNSHTIRIYPGGTGGQGTIMGWGAQVTSSVSGDPVAYGTSYVATAGTSVTRALETASLALPATASQTSGCIAATVTRLSVLSDAVPRYLDFNSSNPLYGGSGTAFGGDDGTNTVDASLCSQSVYSSQGGTQRMSFGWGGGQLSMQVSPSCPNGTRTSDYDGNLWSAATLYIGSQTGTSAHANANLSNIKFGNGPGACL